MLQTKQNAGSAQQAAQQLTAKLDVQLELMKTRVSSLQRLTEELSAARRLLTECCRCDASGRFPAKCDSCQTVAKLGPLPTAVGVL